MTRARQALGLLGLLVALAGIAADNKVIVWVAIGLLGASVLLRVVASVVTRRRDPGEDQAASS